MNTFMEFLTLRFGFIVYIFEFMSEFLKTFIYPGKILLMLKQPPLLSALLLHIHQLHIQAL